MKPPPRYSPPVRDFKPPTRLIAIAVGFVALAAMAFAVLGVILNRARG